ncbi:unnamed protein product [Didymodactylos carnosus]|uniref:Uncharacterized protein n=1 Tax=Didymodactylos carnosus TaxID=1234261 RepID=A0A8S2DHM1_9BILA|nr:unnamed protein product [Didymodactylos carnosus]CAF3678610.1 unnamed protein product [Didymodactylos carnosus]
MNFLSDETKLKKVICHVKTDSLTVGSAGGKMLTNNGNIMINSSYDNISSANYDKNPIFEELQGLTKDLRQFLDARFQKGSIDHDLQQTIRDNLYMRTVPCTTRPPRPGETNGQDYTFLSVKEFKALEKSGNLLENGVYKGHYYGTPRPPKESGTNLLKRSNSVNEMFSNQQQQQQQQQHQQTHRNVKENGNGEPDYLHSYPLNINNDPEFFNGHELETHMYNSSGESPQASSTSSFSNNVQHPSLPFLPNNHHNNHHPSYSNNENGQSNHHSSHQQRHPRHNSTAIDLNRSQSPAHLSGELISCTLHKGQGGFGFTIIGGNEKGEHYLQIKQILPDSPAYRDGQLAQGDILVYVNNQNVLGYSHTDVVKIFQSLSIGDAIRLTVCRGYPLAVDFDDPTVDVISLNGVNGNGNGLIKSPLTIPPTTELLNGGYTEYYGQREREQDQQLYQLSIRKGEKGFGFTVADSLNGQRVKTIVDKQRCHGLCEGDLLLSINGIDLTGKKHLEIVDILIRCTDENDTIFIVKRGQGE